MKNYKLTLLLIMNMILGTGTLQSQSIDRVDYELAGRIELQEPLAQLTGYGDPLGSILSFGLNDVGLYAGHICVGISSGFLLTKQALEALYPGDEIPVRGQVRIWASEESDPSEVASYLLRCRLVDRPDEMPANGLYIDESMQTQQGEIHLIFERSDTGKRVLASFYKHRVVEVSKQKEMKSLKRKIIEGQASEEERIRFAQNVQNMVKKVLTQLPEGAIVTEAL